MYEKDFQLNAEGLPWKAGPCNATESFLTSTVNEVYGEASGFERFLHGNEVD